MKMHEFFFLFILFKECIYECMKCDFLRMHVKIHEICFNMNFWFCSFWKMHIKMHEIWFLLDAFMNAWNFLLNMNFENTYLNAWNLIFFVLFLWCIYECMEFFIKSEFWIWMKMHVWIHKIWFFCTAWRMHMNAWKFDWIWISDFNENACLSVWNLIFLFFLKNAYMNASNFVNFLNENACLNA